MRGTQCHVFLRPLPTTALFLGSNLRAKIMNEKIFPFFTCSIFNPPANRNFTKKGCNIRSTPIDTASHF